MELRRTKGIRRWAPLVVGVPAVVGMSVASVSFAAAARPAKMHATAAHSVHESLVLLADAMAGKDGWPEYVGGSKIIWPKNSTITLTIYAYDDMTTPLTKALRIYDHVRGTVGGNERIDGKAATKVANSDIAHTFTVNGIGLNLPIPEAPKWKQGTLRAPVVVTATFHTGKAGTYTWQCYAPCGTGKGGTAGSMTKPGYMTGKVVVG